MNLFYPFFKLSKLLLPILLLPILLFISLIGCASYQVSDEKSTDKKNEAKQVPVFQQPDDALQAYFEALANKDFSKLAQMYGGDEYYSLQGNNPSIPKNEHAKLLEAYCTKNGGNIVKIDKIFEKKEISNEEYTYLLRFSYLDGTSFRNGFQYTYTVKKVNNSFKVMELPPYLP